MSHKITVIPGDGIGPEITEAAIRCIQATGVTIEWEKVYAGECVMEKQGTPLPNSVIESIRRNRVAIKGPITTPVGKGFRSVNVGLRKALNLYSCIRPCKSYKGIRSRYEGIDLIVVRENTEDLYAGIEYEKGAQTTSDLISFIEKSDRHKLGFDTAISIKPISVSATKKIVKSAFEYAVANKRKKVTVVHKANIMKCTDGLFLEVAREIAKEYEGRVEFEDRIIDNMCMQLVQKPELYDVLVMENLYGDIISDLCAGLVGGLGLAAGANIGDDCAVFEPTHGSAPKYAGQNKVNPTALILSGVLMLHYIGEKEAAVKLEQAVKTVIAEGKDVTYDLKPDRNDPTAVGTAQMADAIIRQVKSK